jgi:hypothetical protein
MKLFGKTFGEEKKPQTDSLYSDYQGIANKEMFYDKENFQNSNKTNNSNTKNANTDNTQTPTQNYSSPSGNYFAAEKKKVLLKKEQSEKKTTQTLSQKMKLSVILIFIALIILFFLKPTFYFSQKENNLFLLNTSNRTISEIKIFNAEDTLQQYISERKLPIIKEITMLGKKETLKVDYNGTGILIALGNGTIPAITYIPKK